MRLATEKLAALENQALPVLLRALQEVNDDTLRFRLETRRGDPAALPLTFAGSLLGGAQQLLRAAAATVLKPQPHHPRLTRSEAQRFIDATRFRHTESGSFVVTVSCPVHALDDVPFLPLLADDARAPFVRRTILTVRRALRQLVAAIEADTVGQLVAEALRPDAAPLISSNFCEALTQFQDDDLQNSLELAVSWAVSVPVPTSEAAGTTAGPVRVSRDYFPRVEEIRRALRAAEQERDDTFVGTVERLDGQLGPDGRRAGEVILALLLPDGGTVRARTNLTADQYATADRVHMREGAYVQVTGRLSPGHQPRTFTGVTGFEQIVASPRQPAAAEPGPEPTA